ncbi:MAG: helix-turn-helix domain-containing protein [Spirosomataceae bacterium]
MQIQFIQITPELLAAMVAESVEAVLDKRLPTFTAPPSEKLLSRKEAAKFLKINIVTLWSRTKEGVIPAHRQGRRVLYRESDLLNSIQRIKTTVAAEG